MQRVLWLFEYATLNGGERSLLACLPTIRAAGFDVLAAAPSRGPLTMRLDAEGVPCIATVWHDDLGRRRPLEEIRTELSALLDGERPDLLHANSLAMGRLAAPVAAEAGIPCIAHLRDIIGLSAAAVADLAKANRLLAVSVATREFHIGQGVPAERTHVLYNGVDLDLFSPRPPTRWLHRELNLPATAHLIGTIGQLVIRKGHDVLAAAARQLADLADLHFVLVGERYSGKDEAVRHVERVRELLGDSRLAGRVHFLGERADVDRLLPELTLLVHPARQEPLGRVLLEAVACGLCVIATDVGGTREIFPTPETARLVRPDDPEALAGAIRQLMDDETLRQAMGQAARRRAEAAFDIRSASAGLVSHYQAVLEGEGMRDEVGMRITKN